MNMKDQGNLMVQQLMLDMEMGKMEKMHNRSRLLQVAQLEGVTCSAPVQVTDNNKIGIGAIVVKKIQASENDLLEEEEMIDKVKGINNCRVKIKLKFGN